MDGLRILFGLIERDFVALLIVLPRMHAFMTSSQLLASTAVPRLARNAAVIVLAMPLVPTSMAYAATFEHTVASFAFHFVKEYAIGFVLGYVVGWIFWVVQSAGAFIDNQRGAAIASSIDPLHGHETSPLGNLFSQTFLTYVFVTGAALPIIGFVYDSFAVWPADRALPVISEDFPGVILRLFDHAMRLTVVLAAPIIAVMFMAEFALAIVSRFAPQVQVFILAMPIKSAVAIFILIFYVTLLFPHAVKELSSAVGSMMMTDSILHRGQSIRQPRPEPDGAGQP